MPGHGGAGHHRLHLAGRGAADLRLARPVHAVQQALQGAAGSARLSRCQEARDAPAPRQVRGHALRPGAQLQGIARWPARPADHPLGGACRRPGQELGRAGQERPGHPARGAPAGPQRPPAQPDPRPAAPDRQAARRPPGVRPADRRGRILRLQEHLLRRRPPGRARQRAADAPVLLVRQGGVAAQPDPDAGDRGAPAQRPRAHAPGPPHRRRVPRQGRPAGSGQRRHLPEEPARHPAHLPGV